MSHSNRLGQDSGAFTFVHDDSQDAPTPQDLRAALERGTDEVKLDTLRRIISESAALFCSLLVLKGSQSSH